MLIGTAHRIIRQDRLEHLAHGHTEHAFRGGCVERESATKPEWTASLDANTYIRLADDFSFELGKGKVAVFGGAGKKLSATGPMDISMTTSTMSTSRNAAQSSQ